MANLRKRPSRKRRMRWLLGSGLLALTLLVNAVAFLQARSMTHFVAGGVRTAPPERLSLVGRLGAMLGGVRIPRPENHRSPRDLSLAFETLRIPIDGDDSLEAWFVPAKSSRALVLLFPPYAASKDALLPTAALFHALGWDTLLVDFRGVGGSTGNDTTLGVREAKDIALAFDFAKSRWPRRPIVLYGASMGAAAVLRAIVAEGVTPDGAIVESSFDCLLHTVRHRFDAMGLPPSPGAEMVVFWGGVSQGSDGFANNPVDYARSVRCPVLLLHGEGDIRVTARESRTLFDALASPRKRFVVFPGSGHGASARADPARWKTEIGAFLRNTVAPR